jgi:type II secretory pathway pseudopilin PulG
VLFRGAAWIDSTDWPRAAVTRYEILFVLTIIVVVSAMAIPQVVAGLDRSRGLIAARYLAGRLSQARIQAVTRSAAVALRFEQQPDGIAFETFQDGNHNGVRTSEIQGEVDFSIEPPTRLWELFPGVAIGLIPGSLATSAVQLSGGSSLLSFTPVGTATSGTVHVRGPDGTQWGVRILGATGRTRLLRWDPRTQQWLDRF